MERLGEKFIPTILWGFFAFLVIILLQMIHDKWPADPEVKQQGVAKEIPNFAPIKDIKGNQWTTKNFGEGTIYLHFWGYWCAPCLVEMPHWIKKHRQLKPNEKIISVHIGGANQRSEILKVVKKYKIKFPVLKDDGHQFAKEFQVSTLPATVTLENGWIVEKTIGPFDFTKE